METITWSSEERQIAQTAFKKAYRREVQSLIEYVQTQAGSITEVNDLWQLHDLLSARRHQLDGKYDSRDASLVFVFAELVKQKLLAVEELEGINPDKLTKIVALSRM